MRKKRLAAILILAMLCVMIPVSVYADVERDDIVMEARVGFDGYFRLEQWTPITVEIENNGGDIQGNLEVVANQNSTSGVLFSRPVVVPKDSKKQFVLYVQVNSIQKEMSINLVEDGKAIKSYEVRGLMPLTWNKYLLAVVTDDKAGMNYWWNTLGNNGIFTNHETVQIKVQNIPDRKEILDNFAILAFDNVDTSLLTEEQQNALLSWIEDGGILIAGTGANGHKTLSGLSREILPLQPGEIGSINAPGELSRIAGIKLPENAMLQVMDLKADTGEFIVEEKGQGLVWKHQIGSGYVFVAAFDLGLEPVVDWAGNKAFWANLLPTYLDAGTVLKLEEPDLERETSLVRSTDLYVSISDALSRIKAMDMPSFMGLLILLLVYLLVVGPVNYVVLKRLDKRELAWITIPLLVVLFSAGIYAMGYTKKGNEVIANTISAIKLQSNSNSAQIDTYAGIFIPKKGDYTISVNKDVLITMFDGGVTEYYSPNEGTGTQSKVIEARVNQGNPSSMEIYDVSVWTMRAMAMSDTKRNFGTIESDLYYLDGKIEGQVTNNTPYALSDLVIYTPYGYQKIGNIASGESKQVDFQLSFTTFNYHGGSNTLYQMLDEMYPYPSGAMGQDDEQREQQVRRSILQGLVVRPGEVKLGMADDSSFVKAFAFCDANLGENIQVNGKEPEKLYYRSLIMADLDTRFEKDGFISIPPGYIRATINRELSDQVNKIGTGEIYLDRGQIVFTLPMDSYKEIELSRVEIKTNIYYGNPLFSVYDTVEETFTDEGEGIKINEGNGTISIEPEALERYIDDQGNLHFKVEANGRDSISIQLPSLVIEGRK